MKDVAMHLVLFGAAGMLLAVAVSCSAVRRESDAALLKATSGAEGYYRWLIGCLGAIENDLPAITEVADRAAEAYLADGCGIGVVGDRGMAGEFNGRAGGIMQTSRPEAIEKDGWRGIALVFPRADAMAWDLAAADRLRGPGRMVILFGTAACRTQADQAGLRYDAFVDTHAAPTAGVPLGADGLQLVPTDPPAAIAAMWTWTGEFVAALTRRGKMPPMYQSIMVPGAAERNAAAQGPKLLEHTGAPMAAGAAGRAYLAELRRSLGAMHKQDMDGIVAVATQAAAARRAGHATHVFAHGHAICRHIGIAHDPGLLHQVNRGLFGLRDDHGIAPGDVVFCVGYDRIFEGWYFKDATTRMRAAGASMAWSMTDYSTDPEYGPSAVPEGETVVGQHWALGDAVVEVPGYDVKILPPSGVVAEAVLWMVEAEMLKQLGVSSDVSP